MRTVLINNFFSNYFQIVHKMIPKLRNFILLAMLVAITTPNTHARRSRIDLPITNAAEAPAPDNIATASGDEPHEIKVETPADFIASTSAATSAALSGVPQLSPAMMLHQSDSGVATEMIADPEEECDPDMIGFEIVTG